MVFNTATTPYYITQLSNATLFLLLTLLCPHHPSVVPPGVFREPAEANNDIGRVGRQINSANRGTDLSNPNMSFF